MLRIGLTGNLGSGKSTVAALFAARGAHVLSSDAIARELMKPGQWVFEELVAHFGRQIIHAGGELDRVELARLAFTEGRADELNAIIHPAVIARQGVLAAELVGEKPDAVLIVETALLFETRYSPQGGPISSWRKRFNRIMLVTAPESEKVARFVLRQHPGHAPAGAVRSALEADARRRLAMQMPDSVKRPHCDYVIMNDGSYQHLEAQVEALWPEIVRAAREPD